MIWKILLGWLILSCIAGPLIGRAIKRMDGR